MAEPHFLDAQHLNRLFPFYLLVNRDLLITGAGSSLVKMCGPLTGLKFPDVFTTHRPSVPVTNIEDLKALQQKLVILETGLCGLQRLRGQLEWLDASGEILFAGSPWFENMEQVRSKNLVVGDFAYHDPLIDLLHLLKTQEITNEDLRDLISTINRQKEELKRANKEVHDIALFPRQNPDPLIRINFNGDLLTNNPAAASLDFLEFENRTIRNDEFFTIIAERIDQDSPRWVIEASCNGRYYSFVCIRMPEEQYINIYGRDITERKKYENEIIRLSMVASSNENGVLFTSPDGRITWANEGFCRLTGYRMEEIIGRSPVELCHGPMTDPVIQEKILGAFFGGVGFSEDIVYHRKDGTWFWGHSVAQPVKNQKGEITEYFGIIQDVSLEKANEEKLKVLSQIAENNINPVIITDASGRITWVNKSFVQTTGFTMEEVVGQKPGHLLQGPETDPETVNYLRNQIAGGQSFNTEILNYQKNGNKYWLRITGQPILDEQGKITGFFALEEDITQEKESALRFRKVLEKIGDNVWEHDFRTGKTYFSKSESELLGYSPDDITDNQSLWWNAVHDEDRYLLKESDARYQKGEITSHSMEYRLISHDGTTKWMLDRGVVVEKDRLGKPLRIIGTHTDITNIKSTEAELAIRVSQFQSLSENIPGVIYEYEFRSDGSEGLCYISPAIERIFGIRPDDFMNYFKYIHPDDQALIIEKNRHSRNTLEPFYAETRLLVPGHPEKWHSVHSAFSYRKPNGDAVFTGFMLDITERKSAESKLEQQRRFYEDILNNMPADIAVFNARHEYLFVNPKGIGDEKLRSWIIGKKDEDYCAYRGKPLSLMEGRRKTFNTVVESGMPCEWEEKNTGPEGEEQFILRRWFPVKDSKNEVVLVIGYGIDITERKKFEIALRVNEEKYRGIIANMNIGLMEMDTHRRIEFANQTLLKMTGLTEEQATGYDAIQFLAEESQPTMTEAKERRMQGVSEAYEVETSISGIKGWWLLSSAPKYDSTGKFSGSIVICLDISEQKKLQQELIRSREQAEQFAKAKEQFLANMSHEIRTPMNAIVGMAGQLNKTALSSEQHHYLDTIRSASDNLLVIINDILDLSKIESGKLTLENIGFEPRNVINRVFQVMKHKAEEKALSFTNNIFDEKISPVLIGDPYRLNQVLLNLVSNAIKFTENGGVDISCELVNEQTGNQRVKFTVTDTGIGMDEVFVEKLFQKFSQEDASVTRKFGGTGLGMSICKELVDLMQGEITVESRKGKGTRIAFSISFNTGTSTDLPKKFNHLTDTGVINGKKILVADDNRMNRMVASAILKNYGAVILMAGDGKEAVEMVLLHNPDIVLMDIQMPEMDGMEATRMLRAAGFHNLPIIALTAFAIKGDNLKCLEAGMNDYLSKPFDEAQLINLVSGWISGNRRKEHGVEFSSDTGVTTEEAANEPLYSLDKIRELSYGDESFVAEMIDVFTEQAEWAITHFRKALLENDIAFIRKVAHRIKPSIKNMGIQQIEETLAVIEQDAETLHRDHVLENSINQVEIILKTVIHQLYQQNKN